MTTETLFASLKDCSDWLIQELSYSPEKLNRPESLRIIKHMCASNISIQELEQAVALITADKDDINHLPSLHYYVRRVRSQKITEAKK